MHIQSTKRLSDEDGNMGNDEVQEYLAGTESIYNTFVYRHIDLNNLITMQNSLPSTDLRPKCLHSKNLASEPPFL